MSWIVQGGRCFKVHFGDCNPGELSHSLICAPVSACRVLRIACSRAIPGGSELASSRRRCVCSARRSSRDAAGGVLITDKSQGPCGDRPSFACPAPDIWSILLMPEKLTKANPALNENRPISERASDDGPFRVDGAKLVSRHRPLSQSLSCVVVPGQTRHRRCGQHNAARLKSTRRRRRSSPGRELTKSRLLLSLDSQPKGSLVGRITRSSSNRRLATLVRNEGWFGFTAYFGG